MNFPVLVGSLLSLTGTQVSAQVKQEHVLPVFGCGTSCRVETEQLNYPETMDDGWIRIKVIQRTWINSKDENGVYRTRLCRGVEDRCGPAESEIWLFADCAGEKFATSSNADRSDSWEQDVFYREGDWKGQPKFQTVHGNPFMRWAKLCPAESAEGREYIRQSYQKLFDSFKSIKNTP